jgi:hypothetical protein
LIQFAIEELQSCHPGECVTCSQLRRGLKEATMYALLSSTWSHHYSQVTVETQSRNAEINLTYALKDFREHRRIAHPVETVAPPWSEAASHAS